MKSEEIVKRILEISEGLVLETSLSYENREKLKEINLLSKRLSHGARKWPTYDPCKLSETHSVIREFRRLVFKHAVKIFGGNVSEATRALGVHRKTLHWNLKQDDQEGAQK